MFPHQQMAVPMLPQAQTGYIYCAYTCHVCSATCWDASWGGGGWGGGCGCSRFSPIEVQTAPEDPAKALEELRKGLELQLASVQAQERVLQERKSAAK
jgi:hypothetical protein